MAHLLLAGEDVHAGMVHQGGKGVAQAVGRERFDREDLAAGVVLAARVQLAAVLPVHVAHVGFPEGDPGVAGHHLIVGRGQDVGTGVRELPQEVDQLLRDRDDAGAALGLRTLEGAVFEVIGFGDADRAVLQIHVGPEQGGRLSAAQAGIEQQHGGRAGTVVELFDAPALFLCQCAALLLRGMPRAPKVFQSWKRAQSEASQTLTASTASGKDNSISHSFAAEA